MVVPQILAGAAAVVGGAKLIEEYRTSEHDSALKKTYKQLQQTVPDGTFYVDHIDVDVAGNPEGELDTNRVPDLILDKQASANLVVEVETADSLQEAGGEARSQLEAFASPGYRRVLVVPSDATELANDAIQSWPVKDDSIYVKTPSTVTEAL